MGRRVDTSDGRSSGRAPTGDTGALARLTALAPLLWIILVLAVLEIGLEWRAHGRCFETLLFGPGACADSPPAVTTTATSAPAFGPVAAWPYRSRIPTDAAVASPMIWIASASHAEHARLPPERIFPNRICEALTTDAPDCLVVNASVAGYRIHTNVTQLREAASRFRIDTAVLYQLANDLAAWQKSADEPEPSAEVSERSAVEWLKGLSRRTSLYQHLSQAITSRLKLAAIRADSIEGAERRLTRALDEFVTTCRRADIEPVLSTFAVAYRANDAHRVPDDWQRTLVRQNASLSVPGYLATVTALNETIRRRAAALGVRTVDLAASIGGRPELFVDMVHFNEAGHEAVAREIASVVSPLAAGDPDR